MAFNFDSTINPYLLIGGILTAIVAILHLGCIRYGAPWYRFFGAGEKMALLAERGSIWPTLITSLIVVALSIWSLYALSGAGVIAELPLLLWVISLTTAVYLLRGVGGLFLIYRPLGRTPVFWLWSSLICLLFGTIHLVGLLQIGP